MTEERAPTFRSALQRVGLREGTDFHVLLHQGAFGSDWATVGTAVLAYCKDRAIDLIVVDTLTVWAGLAGDMENDAGCAMAAMRPVLDFAAAGMAVVVCRHERKSGGELGESARGSSAFGGAMDILVSLRRMPGSETRRELVAVSRFDETPTDVVLELGEDGYEVLGSGGNVMAATAKEALRSIIPTGAENALPTTSHVLPRMREMGHADRTAKRALAALVEMGEVREQRRNEGRAHRQYVWVPETSDEFGEQFDV
jgi:hypothetical protein